MSLIQTYYTKDFGIVCSDGRVSVTLPDGRHAAVPHKIVRRKFIILRADPGLVLAGSSSISKFLDFSIYEAVRRYVEDFPEASFDQVSGIIGPTVYEARAEFGISDARPSKVRRFLADKFFRGPWASPKFLDSTDGNFLNLLGYDRAQMRVRNRTFSCTDRCQESEQDSGVTISGFVDPERAFEFAGELLELIGRQPTPKVIMEAMLSIAADISALLPETIGPPYTFHIVTKGASRGGDIYEEEFRRALANRATVPTGSPPAPLARASG
jgi:hypothetical protein